MYITALLFFASVLLLFLYLYVRKVTRSKDYKASVDAPFYIVALFGVSIIYHFLERKISEKGNRWFII